jgi:hypothetical protein
MSQTEHTPIAAEPPRKDKQMEEQEQQQEQEMEKRRRQQQQEGQDEPMQQPGQPGWKPQQEGSE